MPLLALFIGSLATALVKVFEQFFSLHLALKLASYVTWITVLTAFLASVYTCMSLLKVAIVAGLAALPRLGMGVSFFIPANAGAVIGCIASVWIACQIYKIQKHGISNFSK